MTFQEILKRLDTAGLKAFHYKQQESFMSEIVVFDSDPRKALFEKHSHINQGTYWLASELMQLLGYSDMNAFRKAIARAQIACAHLGIPVEENFVYIRSDDSTSDTKLSRFACYLVAMNA
ncbi:MAG: hypothetical protein KAT58_12870, partial [candidate division Zixibacteria bacterium]|nr:hypothetical protein [candidate division Zixibacteria bacterium]